MNAPAFVIAILSISPVATTLGGFAASNVLISNKPVGLKDLGFFTPPKVILIGPAGTLAFALSSTVVFGLLLAVYYKADVLDSKLLMALPSIVTSEGRRMAKLPPAGM